MTEQTAREVWSSRFGPIPKGWEIHHIDHNPENNDITNLVALTNEEHKRYHCLYNQHFAIWKHKKRSVGHLYNNYIRAYVRILEKALKQFKNA